MNVLLVQICFDLCALQYSLINLAAKNLTTGSTPGKSYTREEFQSVLNQKRSGYPPVGHQRLATSGPLVDFLDTTQVAQ